MSKITITTKELKNCSLELRNMFLKEAVCEDNNDWISFALEAGAELEEGMIAAVDSKNIELLQIFIKFGADVTYKDNCAFSLAAAEGDYEIAKILLEAGAFPRIDMLHCPLNEGHYKILDLRNNF